jgi:cobalt-zinc-cadmium efflux system membrane fusion protein
MANEQIAWKRDGLLTAGIVALGLLVGSLILGIEPRVAADDHDHDHEHEHAHDEGEPERGPHGGRLLEDGDASIEMTMFEDGVPPRFRIFAYNDGKAVEPSAVNLGATLTRLGRPPEAITFKKGPDYLESEQIITEMHSFDVEIKASIAGRDHVWRYENPEARAEIAADAAAAAGVKTATVGPAKLRMDLTATGRIALDPARSAEIRGRFPGVLRDLKKTVGDKVAKGEVIAQIESNDSLQTYAVRSPIDGIVVSQTAVAGEIVGDDPIATIADLSHVIAELHLFPRDVGRLQIGQAVRISAAGGTLNTAGTLAMIAPFAEAASQTVPVRVVIENGEMHWRPGLLVTAQITTGEKEVPLAVAVGALQQIREIDVVFYKVGDSYQAQPVELGESDGAFIEVRGGLSAGTLYVSENSYLIKADIEKSGASHDH